MTAYWWYILKVSMCIIAFYTFYILILRKCTFFLLNRLYLILGLLLSFVIPVLNFSIFESQSNSVLSHMVYPFLMEPEYDFFQPHNLSDHVTTTNYSIILPGIYFAGIFVLFFKLLFSIIRILRIRNHSETCRIGQKKVMKTDSALPFSFFNMIFLPKGETNPLIIEHEMAHVRQFHWLDLILAEIVSILLWFNPFVILYRKSLKLQHEYLADVSVIKDTGQIESYLHCMLKHIQVAGYNGITSQFYCKTVKKRIIMITKDKTSNPYLGAYLFVLPLICLMLSAFSSGQGSAQATVPVFSGQDDGIIQTVWDQPSIYPVDSKKVKRISGYGERTHPITKKKAFHYGIDFSVPEDEEIMSTAAGMVVETSYDAKRGNYILIQHNETFSTFYSHLKSISVQVGDKLEKSRVIGYVGNTGLSTAPHLHYEVIKNGERVNPMNYLPE